MFGRNQEMPYNLEQFRQAIINNGLFQANRSILRISPPQGLPRRSSGVKLREIEYLIDSFSLPGVSWASSDGIRRYGYGIMESRPYVPIFNDLPITIMTDNNADAYSFFYDWTNIMVNYDFTNGISGKRGGYKTYEVGFKEDYVSPEVQALCYNEKNELILVFAMRDVYPTSMDQVPINWSSTDEISRLGVNLHFTDFVMKYQNSSYPSSSLPVI